MKKTKKKVIKKPPKGLSDKELIDKYDKGKINLKKPLKKLLGKPDKVKGKKKK